MTLYAIINRISAILTVFIQIAVKYAIKHNKQSGKTKTKIARYKPIKHKIFYYIVPFKNPTFIDTNLYLGSAFNAASSAIINQFNIKYIINVTDNIPNYFNITYVNVPIKDNNIDKIDDYLDYTYYKISKFQKKNDGNILVHCVFGASRSVTVIMYYLIKKYGLSIDNAFKFVKQKRKLIHPTVTLLKSIIKKTKT